MREWRQQTTKYYFSVFVVQIEKNFTYRSSTLIHGTEHGWCPLEKNWDDKYLLHNNIFTLKIQLNLQD